MDSKTDVWIPLRNPATNEVVTYVPQATPHELNLASEAAHEAFKTWRNTTVLARQRIMFNLQHLIRENMDALAESITLEQVLKF